MTSVAARSPSVCGTKRGRHSEFEVGDEVHSPHGKRHRVFGISGVHVPSLSPITVEAELLHKLYLRFPRMDPQVVGRTLAECDGDMEAALKQLTELSLARSSAPVKGITDDNIHQAQQVAQQANSSSNSDADDLEQWSAALCADMMAAPNEYEAKQRAKKFLARCKAHVESCQNAKNGAQVEHLTKENVVLKRAVAIQHSRMASAPDKDRQILELQSALTQYQDRVRTLELSNYSLSLHLKQATDVSSRDRGPPDVF